MRILGLIALLCWTGVQAVAEQAVSPSKGQQQIATQAQAIVARLPVAAREGLAQLGTRYFNSAEDIITGYGDVDRITGAQLQLYVDYKLAGLRSYALGELAAADLDGDGAVSTSEKAQAMALHSRGLRSRLSRLHRAADQDGDGNVSGEELHTYPGIYAAGEFGDSDRQRVMSVLAFDLDQDGAVTLEELNEGLNALDASGVAGNPMLLLLTQG